MDNNLCVLDFDENGKANIEIPKVQQDYSFILNHWMHPLIQLGEIENDLLGLGSPDRKLFLDKAKQILSECLEQYAFGDISGDVDNEDWIDNDFPSDKDTEIYLDAQFGNDAEWNFGTLDEPESEEEREFNLIESKANIFLETGEDSQYKNPQYLIIYNVRLRHSLAWYLMNRINNEILLIERQIERENGLLKIARNPEGIDKTIEIIRRSGSPFEAKSKLMEYFQLSTLQATALAEIKLKDITAIKEKNVLKRIEFCNFIKSLLEKMKL